MRSFRSVSRCAILFAAPSIAVAKVAVCAPVKEENWAVQESSSNASASSVSLKDCPLDRSELGEKTWSLLHTMAAYYPENPSQEQEEAAANFIRALALLYPCKHCAEDFQQEVEKNPPDVSSGTSFALWVCQQHNIVNEKIGKKTFPCNMDKINERWKTGSDVCWLSDKATLHDEQDEEE